MRIVRFRCTHDDSVRYGSLVNDTVYAIQGDPYGAHAEAGAAVGSVRDVLLCSPCLPGKIVALAANYAGATGVTDTMTEPVIFLKPASSVTGPFDDIVSPFKSVSVWGEAELAIVVGKRLQKASLQEAESAVFGYTCADDVTAENVEGRDHHLVRSKGADTFCPLGPWIDTEFRPGKAAIEGYQNGTLIRAGTLDRRIWSDAKTLQWLSQWLTLDPGDVVLTGTPPRVVGKTFLGDGDVYEVRIAGLGSLKNRFLVRAAV